MNPLKETADQYFNEVLYYFHNQLGMNHKIYSRCTSYPNVPNEYYIHLFVENQMILTVLFTQSEANVFYQKPYAKQERETPRVSIDDQRNKLVLLSWIWHCFLKFLTK